MKSFLMQKFKKKFKSVCRKVSAYLDRIAMTLVHHVVVRDRGVISTNFSRSVSVAQQDDAAEAKG